MWFALIVLPCLVYLLKWVVYWAVFNIADRFFGRRPDLPITTVGGRISVDCHCADCGYNLKTLHNSGICPECGNQYDVALVPAPYDPLSLSSPRSAASLACLFDFFGSMVLVMSALNNLWYGVVELESVRALLWSLVFFITANRFQTGKRYALSFIGLGLLATALTDGLLLGILYAMMSSLGGC